MASHRTKKRTGRAHTARADGFHLFFFCFYSPSFAFAIGQMQVGEDRLLPVVAGVVGSQRYQHLSNIHKTKKRKGCAMERGKAPWGFGIPPRAYH